MCIGGTNKIIDGQDNPGPDKDIGIVLTLHFGFKRIDGKEKKGPELPVKKEGRPCKTFHTGIPRNMDTNETSS